MTEMIESNAIRWNVDRQNKDKEADISREIDGDAKGMKHTDSEANAKEAIETNKKSENVI